VEDKDKGESEDSEEVKEKRARGCQVKRAEDVSQENGAWWRVH
jgi:hypothetical protein